MSLMRWTIALLTLVLCLVSCPQASFATNGPLLTTLGTKGPVNLPADGDAFTAYRMPSSMGWAYNNRFDLDLFLFYSRSTLQNSLNDYTATGTAFGGGLGLIFAPGRPGFDAPDEDWKDYSSANKFTFSIGEFVEIGGGGGTSQIRSQEFPETFGVGTGVQFLATAVSMAYTPTEWLSFGIGLHFYYATLDVTTVSGAAGGSTLSGSPTIDGVPIPGNPTYADFLDIFGNDADSDPNTILKTELSSFQLGAIFSISVKPTDYIAFGFSYKPRSTKSTFEGDAELDATRTFQGAVGDLPQIIQDIFFGTLPNGGGNGFNSPAEIEIENLTVPRQIRGSVSFRPMQNLVLGFEVAWIEWHRSFRVVKVRVKNIQNEDISFVIGDNKVDTTIRLRFHNSWLFAGYAAYGITPDLTVRAGFVYGETPINKDETGNSPNPAFVNATASVGVGYWVLPNLEVSTLVEFSFSREVRGDGSDRTATGKFNRYSSDQAIAHLGISYHF